MPGLPMSSLTRSLSKRVRASPNTTALGHTGYQLSSNNGRSAFAIHNSAGEYAASFAAGPRFMRSTYSDGSQFVLDTSMPVTPHWYQLTNGVKFRFKKIKKTGSLGLLALDKVGGRLMIHIEKGGMLHFSVPKGKSAKAQLRNGRLPKSKAEALESFDAMVDNKSTWTADDDFRGVSGDYPAGTGWSFTPGRGSKTPGHSSSSATRSTQYEQHTCTDSTCGSPSWSPSWSYPSYSFPSYSPDASVSFSISYSDNQVAVTDKKDKANTLACLNATLTLVAALAAAVIGGTLAIGLGCVVAGVITLGAACVAGILGSAILNTVLVAAAVQYADACL
jgi:hypothetical protein